MGWWMGVECWENLGEGEEEEEDERKKEGKKKSRGSIDRLIDPLPILSFFFFILFFFLPFSIDVLPIFFPPGKKTITHHSTTRSHLASKNISFSLSPSQGTLRISTPGINRNIFLLLLLRARERERGVIRDHEE